MASTTVERQGRRQVSGGGPEWQGGSHEGMGPQVRIWRRKLLGTGEVTLSFSIEHDCQLNLFLVVRRLF